MPDPRAAAEASALVLDYARYASRAGWNGGSLRRFLGERGLSAAQATALWPDGVRGLGRAFNALADTRTAELFRDRPAASMAEIVLSRFVQNADLRLSVRALALSDLIHPIDTLRRTEKTARLMWACRRPAEGSTKRGGRLDRWTLVLAYSLCVVVWIVDGSRDQAFTRRFVALSLAAIGAR